MSSKKKRNNRSPAKEDPAKPKTVVEPTVVKPIFWSAPAFVGPFVSSIPTFSADEKTTKVMEYLGDEQVRIVRHVKVNKGSPVQSELAMVLDFSEVTREQLIRLAANSFVVVGLQAVYRHKDVTDKVRKIPSLWSGTCNVATFLRLMNANTKIRLPVDKKAQASRLFKEMTDSQRKEYLKELGSSLSPEDVQMLVDAA